MEPNISVIIPVYNTKSYLLEAINSIIEQKIFIKEIIIVDDGSTDRSSELLENQYGNINYIKIIHIENHGQGHARNLGTEISTGDFIYYFDSDDIAAPNLLERFNNKLLEIPDLDLFCFSGESFLDKNSLLKSLSKQGTLSKEAYKRKINISCTSGEEAFNLLVENNAFFPGPPFYIIKKSLLISHNIKFNSIRYEDEDFTHRLFLYAQRTYITNEILYRRRVRAGSTMQKGGSFTDITGYFEIINSLKKLKELNFLKHETKEVLDQRIETFIRITIKLNASRNYKLTKVQKKYFRSFLKPVIGNKLCLLMYFYKYPLEYKLRVLKNNYFINKKSQS